MDLRVIKTADKVAIRNAIVAVGSEAHNLEENEITWIAFDGDKILGIIGIRHQQNDYVIIDIGPAALQTPSSQERKHVIEVLLGKVETEARLFTNKLYTHNAEEMVDVLINDAGFTKTLEIPVGYSHPCMMCGKRNVSCFPELLTKELT